jgi:hypothetical protein
LPRLTRYPTPYDGNDGEGKKACAPTGDKRYYSGFLIQLPSKHGTHSNRERQDKNGWCKRNQPDTRDTKEHLCRRHQSHECTYHSNYQHDGRA